MFEIIVCNSEKKTRKIFACKARASSTSSLYIEPNKLYACERAKKKRRSK